MTFHRRPVVNYRNDWIPLINCDETVKAKKGKNTFQEFDSRHCLLWGQKRIAKNVTSSKPECFTLLRSCDSFQFASQAIIRD